MKADILYNKHAANGYNLTGLMVYNTDEYI